MGENSDISWTHSTFNPWVGCSQVSPACDHCYAMVLDRRWGKDRWGVGKPRERTSESNWKLPLRWNAKAEKAGVRHRVFCASLADVFDDEVDPTWRLDLFALIRTTPFLDWMLLTKRPHNIRKMLPADWGTGYPNVWLGTTAENQRFVDIRIPVLVKIPAVIHFVSMEPLLGPVDLKRWLEPICKTCGGSGSIPVAGGGAACGACFEVNGGSPGPLPSLIQWIIVGGESGAKPRLMRAEWARDLREQCAKAGVAFHFKQAGKSLGRQWGDEGGHGDDMSKWPAEFNVRQYPQPRR